MSKSWYPIINYENCTECGACIEKCSHKVYNIDKAPSPQVVNPEGCVEGCTGCADLCPAQAITYFGDNGQKKSDGCCSSGCDCGCDCSDSESDPECDCDSGCSCC